MFSWFKAFFPQKKQEQHWIADTSVAGLQYYRGNDLAELISVGDELNLRRQPENPYDEHAVMVMWHHNKIGYVPRALAQSIDRQMTAGVPITASIVEVKPVRFGRKWIKMRLQTKSQESV